MSRCFLSCKGVNDHTSEAMVRTRDLTHVSTHGSEYLKYPPSRPIWAVWFRCRGSGGGGIKNQGLIMYPQSVQNIALRRVVPEPAQDTS